MMLRNVIRVSVGCMALLVAGTGWADNSHKRKLVLVAKPFVFVGRTAECGGTPGSKIVTSAWLPGMGLPDKGGDTALNAPNLATRKDPHEGLLLNKNGPTTDCSAAGAEIKVSGFKGDIILTELGFDYRNGGHCGAGAPRFNVTSTEGFTYFFGCFHGAKSPAPQDPDDWTRVRFSATQGTVFPASPDAPPFVFGPGGTRVESISIIFDEGTDTPSPTGDAPAGVGLAVLDNIDINGILITNRKGVTVKTHVPPAAP